MILDDLPFPVPFVDFANYENDLQIDSFCIFTRCHAFTMTIYVHIGGKTHLLIST
jgi:hypothetical protein